MNIIYEKRFVQHLKTLEIFEMVIEKEVSETLDIEIQFTLCHLEDGLLNLTNRRHWKSFNVLTETVLSTLEKNQLIPYHYESDVYIEYKGKSM